MIYRIEFTSEEEKENIIKANRDKTLLAIEYLADKSCLKFTDEEIVYELSEIEILATKVSVLTTEIEQLKKDNEMFKQAFREVLLPEQIELLNL